MNDFNELHSLYHYGIKGQKWGIRRFQNKDGTLTSEGMLRYEINEKGAMSKAGYERYKEDLEQTKVNTKAAVAKGALTGAAAALVINQGKHYVGKAIASNPTIYEENLPLYLKGLSMYGANLKKDSSGLAVPNKYGLYTQDGVKIFASMALGSLIAMPIAALRASSKNKKIKKEEQRAKKLIEELDEK